MVLSNTFLPFLTSLLVCLHVFYICFRRSFFLLITFYLNLCLWSFYLWSRWCLRLFLKIIYISLLWFLILLSHLLIFSQLQQLNIGIFDLLAQLCFIKVGYSRIERFPRFLYVAIYKLVIEVYVSSIH